PFGGSASDRGRADQHTRDRGGGTAVNWLVRASVGGRDRGRFALAAVAPATSRAVAAQVGDQSGRPARARTAAAGPGVDRPDAAPGAGGPGAGRPRTGRRGSAQTTDPPACRCRRTRPAPRHGAPAGPASARPLAPLYRRRRRPAR